MRTLAVLSMHTSPLAQPGTGDGGGMNVYVRELSSALARSGISCEVFTRREDPGQPATVDVEPGLRVHHVDAGPPAPVCKERLPGLVSAWTAGVARRLDELADAGRPVEALHANYWLSGLAGHTLKHERDLPLVVTFHTLDRVKAESSPEALDAHEPARREAAELGIVACADAVLASCTVEVEQLVSLYRADPVRVVTVPPAVDHAFFGPGDRVQARRALGLRPDVPVVLFVGRIQPLKGLTVAVDALARLESAGGRTPDLVVIGGPSGPDGPGELRAARAAVDRLGLAGRVHWWPPQAHELLSTSYRAADVCVVPSRSESFGLVALEAAACGVPVVASAVGGLTTLVDDGRTGFLVDPRRPEAFAERVGRLLGDRGLAAAMGRAAVAHARRYTWKEAARRFRACGETLLSRDLVACR